MIRDRRFFGRKTKTFTLQWHLTNACPFHCRHCYDRSTRGELNALQIEKTFSDFLSFCRKRRVEPRISLSGGDPLLHPDFWELYRRIDEADVPVSILGNPIDEETIQKLFSIRPPTYYQVSLEGEREHNDAIRGEGHFDRVMRFLYNARALRLPTHVMLTLTRANIEQVLPLAESLRGLTVRFTFNRLAAVGEGADLEAPDKTEYAAFLVRYLEARRFNPVLGVKDNLFNIVRANYRRRLFPGCTGFGCGAGFNFVALLPDGEVHACRKFPSRLGSILETDLGGIFDSEEARRYRRGVEACGACRLRRSCGGCPAVSFGRGLNPLADRDPDCFLGEMGEYQLTNKGLEQGKA